MRILLVAMMLTGCGNDLTSDSALVSGLRGPMADLAGALVVDGGPKSQRAGRVVIAKFDAGTR